MRDRAARTASSARLPSRWPRRIALLVAGVSVLLVVGWLAAPAVVGWVVRSQLAAAGWPRAAIGEVRLTTASLELRDLDLGPDLGCQVGAVRVEFSPAQLWARRVGRVEVRGLALVAARGADGWQLAALSGREGTASEPPPASGTLPQWLVDAPLDALEIAGAALELRADEAVQRVRWHGAVTAPQAGRLTADFELSGVGLTSELRLGLEVAPTAAEGEWSVAVRAAEDAPRRVAGRLQGDLSLRAAPGGMQVEVGGKGRDLSVARTTATPVAVDGVSLEFTARAEHGLAEAEVRLQTDAGGARLPTGHTAHGDLRISYRSAGSAGGPAPPLQLWLAAGEVRDAGGETVADAIEGEVAFSSLQPLRSAPATFTWAALSMGELRTVDGELSIEVEGADRLAVRSLLCGLAPHGVIVLTPFELRLPSPTIATRVELEEVPLDGWLQLLSRGKVRGEGTLTGGIDVEVRTEPRLALALGDGRFEARGGGSFEVDDLAAARDVLTQQLAASGEQVDDAVRRAILDSLAEFDFDRLSFEIVPDAPERVLRVQTAGRGRTVGRELDLTVNFRGFEALVDLLLELKLGWDRMTTLTGPNK